MPQQAKLNIFAMAISKWSCDRYGMLWPGLQRVSLRLDEMAKLVAVLHLMPGEPIFTTDSLDESVPWMKIT